MRKYSCIWMLLCCLAYGGMTSCSGKKSDADEQDKGVSTVLPDSKNEVTVQILKRCDFHHEVPAGRLIFVLKRMRLLLMSM